MSRKRSISELTLTRTMCFGPCPVYTVTVNGDGIISWHGEYYVQEVGHRHWSVPIEVVSELNKALARLRFDDLEDSYSDSCMTDGPWCNIEVKYSDGGYKRVSHYRSDDSAPKQLIALQNRIDRILGTELYIGDTEDDNW